MKWCLCADKSIFVTCWYHLLLECTSLGIVSSILFLNNMAQSMNWPLWQHLHIRVGRRAPDWWREGILRTPILLDSTASGEQHTQFCIVYHRTTHSTLNNTTLRMLYGNSQYCKWRLSLLHCSIWPPFRQAIEDNKEWERTYGKWRLSLLQLPQPLTKHIWWTMTK